MRFLLHSNFSESKKLKIYQNPLMRNDSPFLSVNGPVDTDFDDTMAMRVMFLNTCAPKRPRHCPSLDVGDTNRYTWERPRLSCLQDRAKIKLITSLAKRKFIHTLESQTRRVSASPERAPPADHCQIMEPQIAWSLCKHSSPMLKQGGKLDQGQRGARP